MESLKISFADCGKDNTFFLSRLLQSKGALKICTDNIYSDSASLCDLVIDEGSVSYERLKAVNSSIILVSLTPFGLTGSKRSWKGDSYTLAAAGGSMNMCGIPGREPLAPAGRQACKVSALFALNAVMLALIDRVKTGTGSHIDISMQECVAGTLDLVLVRNFYYGENPCRTGSVTWNRQCFIAPCKDGKIMINLRPADWVSIRDWLNTDAMAEDLIEDAWNDKAYRHDNIDHIVKVISEWTKTYTTDELFETSQLMGLSWAFVKEA